MSPGCNYHPAVVSNIVSWLEIGDIENFQWQLLPSKYHNYHDHCCNEIFKDGTSKYT